MSQYKEATDLTEAGRRKNQKGKERSFFEHAQPTFVVDIPRITTLEFLDESNPAKDTIVRKKAREWVHQNKVNTRKSRQRRQPSRTDSGKSDDTTEDAQLQRRSSSATVRLPSPLRAVGVRRLDVFNVLPDVGTNYDHLLDYFLRGCPGVTPCLSDGRASLVPIMNTTDDHAHISRHSIIPFVSANTILRELGQSQVTFVLFLYAVASMREGFSGSSNMAELHCFYNNALRQLQATLNKEIASGVFSDHLLLSLGIIAAIACFAGMFDTATMHRNALIKILGMRGDGNVLEGVYTTSQWTRKAIQWLEILIAIQLIETPQIPYICTSPSTPLCPNILLEAQRLTSLTLQRFPNLPNSLQHVILLLHQLGVAYNNLPSNTRTDIYIIRPLYDAQYTLLQILEAHKNEHNLSPLEYLLAESFQLYYAIGPRANPPQMRLLDLLVARVQAALVPFLGPDLPCLPTSHGVYDEPTSDAIAFSLALGTMVAAWMERPERVWFRAHLCEWLGEWDGERYGRMLGVFPTTEGYVWLSVGMGW